MITINHIFILFILFWRTQSTSVSCRRTLINGVLHYRRNSSTTARHPRLAREKGAFLFAKNKYITAGFFLCFAFLFPFFFFFWYTRKFSACVKRAGKKKEKKNVLVVGMYGNFTAATDDDETIMTALFCRHRRLSRARTTFSINFAHLRNIPRYIFYAWYAFES